MSPDTLFAALDRVAPVTRVVLAGLAHRGQLAAVEAGEARAHFAVSLLLAAGVFALALLSGIALTFALAAAVWHRDDRELLLGLLTGAYFLAGCALAWGLVCRLRSWRPLAETRLQLRQDGACLVRLIPDDKADSTV